MTNPIDEISLISLTSLKRYLLANKWHRHVVPSGAELFTFIEDKEIEIVLPATSQIRDAPRRIADAVATLVALEGMPFNQIVAAIRSISYDLVRSSLPDSAIRHNTIRLDVAEEFIRRMTRVLASSAHNELHRGPYAQRFSTTATDYANECRFGHTFKGSFGFIIESHVGPKTIGVGEVDPSPPLARRAVVRLIRGLAIIQDAISDQNPNRIVQSYEIGLNANACEDLAAIIEMPQVGSVNYEIKFSPEWGVPADVRSRTIAELGHAQAIEILKEAAKALRVVNYEKLQTIQGKIRTLHSMEIPADLFTISGLQDIYVEWDSSQFGRRTVLVSLGPEDYLEAVKAHTAGWTVSVFGELERGRRWYLDNARDFRVFETT